MQPTGKNKMITKSIFLSNKALYLDELKSESMMQLTMNMFDRVHK